uniref:Uncharacterized protein n=1 Tax=Plectus sambesii TaxID=2011161 RepID=A0A914VVD3_9BILA
MAESVRSSKKRPKPCNRLETARQAAKVRRDEENDIFAELQATIPGAKESNVSHIDRIALLRLVVTLIRLRGCAPTLMTTVLDNAKKEYPWSEDIITSCLDGFIIICDGDGVILYSTESVAKYLGLNQPISFCLRTLYDSNTQQHIWLMLATTAPVGSRSLHNEVTNRCSANSTFVTRHTYDMKLSYADESLKSHLKLEPETLIGTSFYNLVHPEDLLNLVESLKVLFKKMHCRTPYYRLMGGCGTLIWVQTEASTVSSTSRSQCNHVQNVDESNSITVDAIVSAKTNTTVNDLQVNERMDSINEVLLWLKSDLPDRPPSDLDTISDIAANTPYNKKQSQDSLIQQQDSQLAICNEIASNVHLPEADTMKFSSIYAGKDILLPQIPIKNNSTNIRFDHQTTMSQSQHFDNDGFLNENSTYAYPHLSTVLSSTIDSLSSNNATEMLKTLAPFVAQEEMLPLDMQGLTADFYMDEWFQSDLKTKDCAHRLLMTPPPPAYMAY